MDKKNRFSNLSFDEFRALAKDPSLTKYERIGFPDAYRKGFEQAIFLDICAKLSNLELKKMRILDIGPGCSDIPQMLIDKCAINKHSLTLMDSIEMLDQLQDAEFIEKRHAMFPDCADWIAANKQTFNVVICYSVLHYILIDTAFFRFLDCALSLLAPGGQLLIGDVPNISKRKRFFSSAVGVAFHKKFMNTDESPKVLFNNIEHDQIDDSVVFSILLRARNQGFDAYVMPQHYDLPMANRREDILIIRP